MKYDDNFKYMVGGYFGIKTMDEFSSKLYVLKDIENYIKKYVSMSDKNVNYKEIAKEKGLS